MNNSHMSGSIAVLLLAISMFSSCERGNKEVENQTAATDTFVFGNKPDSGIVFLSTQLNPVGEARMMREVILKDFPGIVDFRPNNSAYFARQIDMVLQENPHESIVLGALHGEFINLYEAHRIQALDWLYTELKDRGFTDTFVNLSKLDGKAVYYIPWMQASFVLVVNKKALGYLPSGLDPNKLTYEDLYEWMLAIQVKTGKRALGFPAGENGLMHRFLQGYLYPSYTGSALARFRSTDAVSMWTFLKFLWSVVQPASLDYSSMADPLLVEDVWVAWDHSARLIKVFEEKPDDFMAIPAPIGPKGRGFIAILAGLGIPRGVTSPKDPSILIDYLTQAHIQATTLQETGFFPVVSIAQIKHLEPIFR